MSRVGRMVVELEYHPYNALLHVAEKHRDSKALRFRLLIDVLPKHAMLRISLNRCMTHGA